MAERDSRGMIRTSLHVPYRPKALNLTLPFMPLTGPQRWGRRSTGFWGFETFTDTR
jgi:hypothetical protein